MYESAIPMQSWFVTVTRSKVFAQAKRNWKYCLYHRLYEQLVLEDGDHVGRIPVVAANGTARLNRQEICRFNSNSKMVWRMWSNGALWIRMKQSWWPARTSKTCSHRWCLVKSVKVTLTYRTRIKIGIGINYLDGVKRIASKKIKIGSATSILYRLKRYLKKFS